jgi:hypothetical protein
MFHAYVALKSTTVIVQNTLRCLANPQSLYMSKDTNLTPRRQSTEYFTFLDLDGLSEPQSPKDFLVGITIEPEFGTVM